MPADQPISGAYFDTPARAERLQLLLHLVRNSGDVIYLRAPAGAGKTRFVHRLFDELGDEMAAVRIRAGRDDDVRSAILAQIGPATVDVDRWPDMALDAAGDRDLLVIVDDADRLGLSAVEHLAALHVSGGRLLLVGHGRLAHGARDWDAQFVDLPSFDVQQTAAFLRAQAGQEAACVTEDLAAALHRAAHGLPGPLLDALNEVLLRARQPRPAKRAAAAPSPGHGWPVLQWLAGGAVLTVLAAALVFQDQINALFEPGPGEPAAPRDQSPVETGSVVESVRGIESGTAPDSLTAGPPAPPPEIALPEISQVPADVVPDSPVAPTPAPAAAAPPTVSAPSTVVARELSPVVSDPAPPAAEDPLDAVMRDAIAAAGVQTGPEVAHEASAPESGSGDDAATVATPEPVSPESDARHAAAEPAVPAPVETPKRVQQAEPEGPKADRVSEQPQQGAPAALPGKSPDTTATPVPAPVETRPAQAVKSGPPTGGPEWLKDRDPDHYTLQLVGARDRDAIGKFIREHAIEQPYAIFERELKGRPWYSLVSGDYRDRDAAIAARGRLSKPLQESGVWPRTFESIHKIK